jgi:hypothetical protein
MADIVKKNGGTHQQMLATAQAKTIPISTAGSKS